LSSVGHFDAPSIGASPARVLGPIRAQFVPVPGNPKGSASLLLQVLPADLGLASQLKERHVRKLLIGAAGIAAAVVAASPAAAQSYYSPYTYGYSNYGYSYPSYGYTYPSYSYSYPSYSYGYSYPRYQSYGYSNRSYAYSGSRHRHHHRRDRDWDREGDRD
jgi:hypothetical protein